MTIKHGLKCLITELKETRLKEKKEWYMIRLARLERAALLLETPESFRSESGRELTHLINQVRELLGKPVPKSILLVPGPPPLWKLRNPKNLIEEIRTAIKRRSSRRN